MPGIRGRGGRLNAVDKVSFTLESGKTIALVGQSGGKIVEYGPADQVILDPQHDYTKLLLHASPDPDKHFA